MVKAMGGTYDESDGEKSLRKKVTKLMASTKVLNPRAVDGVVTTLPDCIGLFLDPTTAMCQKCPERGACKVKFDENLKNKFPQVRRQHVDKALADLKKDPKGKSSKKPDAGAVGAEVVLKDAKKKAEKEEAPKVKAAVKTKDGKSLTFERPIKINGSHPKDNPYKGEDAYDLVKAVLTKKPKTIGDLVKIYGGLYELPKKPSQQLAEAVVMIDFLRESEIVKLLAVK